MDQQPAARQDFDPTYDRCGSFTSFPLSRRVRFASESEHSMPAFMSTRPSTVTRGITRRGRRAYFYSLNTRHDYALCRHSLPPPSGAIALGQLVGERLTGFLRLPLLALAAQPVLLLVVLSHAGGYFSA